MTSAPQGACYGRAPPSLRSPPAIPAIDLPTRTYRKIWTQLPPAAHPALTLALAATKQPAFQTAFLPDGLTNKANRRCRSGAVVGDGKSERSREKPNH